MQQNKTKQKRKKWKTNKQRKKRAKQICTDELKIEKAQPKRQERKRSKFKEHIHENHEQT